VEKRDHSPVIPQRSKLKHSLTIYQREWSETQKRFLEMAFDKQTKMMFVSGPAGTSKTYMAVFVALTLLNQRRVSDLIYVRSIVESSDRSIGALPGYVDEKVGVYMEPLHDKLREFLPKNEIDMLTKDQRVSAIPVSFLRGLNWNCRMVIADEAQNMTMKELTTLITRVGEFSKVIVAGDGEQSDINGKSGFLKMMNIFDDEESVQNGIRAFHFTEEDIVRSEFVKFVVKKLRKQV
jgi:phosphate starvation-inducible protein PhoH and related proteins